MLYAVQLVQDGFNMCFTRPYLPSLASLADPKTSLPSSWIDHMEIASVAGSHRVVS